jgi:SAM-dependent methyltransferase
VDWRRVSAESYFATCRLLRELAGLRGYVNGRMLDIGCGVKPYRVLYEALVSRHVGMDIPYSYHGTSAVDVYGSSLDLPFGGEQFDSVLCTEVLEHVPDPFRVLAEIARVLRPGGVAVVSTPFMYRLHEQPYDFFRYTSFAYRALADRAGFEIVELRSRGGAPSVALDLFFKMLSLAVSGLNSFARRMGYGGPHLLSTRAAKAVFYILQAPAVALFGSEVLKADTYTLGYVAVLRKLPAAQQPR